MTPLGSLLPRTAFFFLHVSVHLSCYLLPALLYTLCVQGPLRLLHALGVPVWTKCTRSDASARRRIVVITAPSDTHTAYLFGLTQAGGSDEAAQTSTPVPSLSYDGPLYNGHIHTVLGSMRFFAPLKMRRAVVASYDGCRICLDCFLPSDLPHAAPHHNTTITSKANNDDDDDAMGKSMRAVVLILPGLMSSSAETYIQRAVYACAAAGLAVVVLNARGVGDTPLDAPHIFSAIHTEDLRFVLAHHLVTLPLVQQYAATVNTSVALPVIGLGFSLGGVVLSNYVGEQGKRRVPSGLAAAYTVTAPHDTTHCDRHMSRWLQRAVYGPALSRGMREYILRHRHITRHLPGIDTAALFDPHRPLLRRLRSVRACDAHVTAPHFHFDSVDAYYAAANNFTNLVYSTTPQMCIAARDDPICGPPEPAERWRGLAEEHVGGLVYVEMPSGGHLGFLGTPLQEWQLRPSPLERFVVASMRCFLTRRQRQEKQGK